MNANTSINFLTLLANDKEYLSIQIRTMTIHSDIVIKD